VGEDGSGGRSEEGSGVRLLVVFHATFRFTRSMAIVQFRAIAPYHCGIWVSFGDLRQSSDKEPKQAT